MAKFTSALVVSHVVYRNPPQYEPIEGPYSSICRALGSMISDTSILGLPLFEGNYKVIYGLWGKTKNFVLPQFFGKINIFKYLLDFVVISFSMFHWTSKRRNEKRLVIGIDPLSALPLWMLKKLLGYTFIFHAVDFNKNRFSNPWLQGAYEKADQLATRFSDQTWVVCESLREYKKERYDVSSFYLPNSTMFDNSISRDGSKRRTGNKMVWTGGLSTERQFNILFRKLKFFQEKIRKNMSFVLAPTNEYDKFDSFVKKYHLKNTRVLRLSSRLEFQKIASTCDVGIALYDDKFGSTEFIEPTKIWDFLLCGLPFIVSSEPSVLEAVFKDGVAFRLNKANKVPAGTGLKKFLTKSNLSKKLGPCLKIAKEYDIRRQIKKSLSLLEKG